MDNVHITHLSPDILYERTLSFDKEDIENIIRRNYLAQTPEELAELLSSIANNGFLDDVIDQAYEAIEDVLAKYIKHHQKYNLVP